mmetsp:Transcript_17842/g.45058  ORF Transcript_17842/g.45058 Transcript_17842/m.45058 type:complete len:207 (-) Transcript_17842:1187-1807(-)
MTFTFSTFPTTFGSVRSRGRSFPRASPLTPRREVSSARARRPAPVATTRRLLLSESFSLSWGAATREGTLTTATYSTQRPSPGLRSAPTPTPWRPCAFVATWRRGWSLCLRTSCFALEARRATTRCEPSGAFATRLTSSTAPPCHGSPPPASLRVPRRRPVRTQRGRLTPRLPSLCFLEAGPTTGWMTSTCWMCRESSAPPTPCRP